MNTTEHSILNSVIETLQFPQLITQGPDGKNQRRPKSAYQKDLRALWLRAVGWGLWAVLP
jgi:hypothetical protein